MSNSDDFSKIFPDAVTIEVDPGDSVVCDICDEDFTSRTDSGGFLFLSRGVCPLCAADFEAKIEDGERQYIRARCPPGMAFSDWVRDVLRTNDNELAQRIKCRNILTAGVENMVRQIAEAGVSLNVFVDDFSNYGNYLVACSMLEQKLTRDQMATIFLQRIEETTEQAVADLSAKSH